MDILSLLYTAGSYKLTASGAALEAIWNEKPIFAIKNDYLEYLFEKFGPLGYLANDVTELADVLNKQASDELTSYKQNIIRLKEFLYPSCVKCQLLNIVKG